PIGIADQGATHRNQIELPLIEPLEKAFDIGRLGHFIGLDHELQKLAVQADAAHGDGWLACQLTCPASKIEVRTVEFRLPETPGRAMEDIHARRRQRLEKLA